MNNFGFLELRARIKSHRIVVRYLIMIKVDDHGK